jgi:hypothetical protein
VRETDPFRKGDAFRDQSALESSDLLQKEKVRIRLAESFSHFRKG